MSVEERLVELLDPATPKRIYRERLPDGAALPAQVYTRISAPRTYTHDGDTQLVTIRFQIDAWADNPDEADDVAEVGALSLSGYFDSFIQSVFIDDDRDLHEPENSLYRRIVDLLVTCPTSEAGS